MKKIFLFMVMLSMSLSLFSQNTENLYSKNETWIKIAGMKKPGILPVDFLVKEGEHYKKIFFTVKVKNWNNPQKSRIAYVHMFSRNVDSIKENLSDEGYMTEKEFLSKAKNNNYKSPVFHCIWGKEFPSMGIEKMLHVLLQKAQNEHNANDEQGNRVK